MRPIIVGIDTIKGLATAAAMALDANNATAARLLVSGILTEIEAAERRGVRMPRDRRTVRIEEPCHE